MRTRKPNLFFRVLLKALAPLAERLEQSTARTIRNGTMYERYLAVSRLFYMQDEQLLAQLLKHLLPSESALRQPPDVGFTSFTSTQDILASTLEQGAIVSLRLRDPDIMVEWIAQLQAQPLQTKTLMAITRELIRTLPDTLLAKADLVDNWRAMVNQPDADLRYAPRNAYEQIGTIARASFGHIRNFNLAVERIVLDRIREQNL